MTRFAHRPFLALAFAWTLALAWALAGAAAAAPPMWRIQGPKAEVVLFGSVHMLSDQAQWITPELEAALGAAEQVWFEIPVDPDTQRRASLAANRRGWLPQNVRLTDQLDPEGREHMARAAARLSLDLDLLDRVRPWYAEVLIGLADLHYRGARTSLGVEERLQPLVPPGASRHAFETPEQQVAMLADRPLADQAAMLLHTLRRLEAEPDGFTRLQTAWLEGDVAWLDQEAVAPLQRLAPRLYRRLVVDRNRRWTARIERLLNGSERVFIVVGVGHLVGEDGVPAMLRRRGFVVEGP